MLWKKLSSIENLFTAWQQFCRGKRLRADVMQYERFLEENLFFLRDALRDGTYRHGLYTPFVVRDPKERRIHKATVVDRIVHQAITQVIEPLFEPRFIFDSFSCRIGKGTHAAVNRLRHFLYRESRNRTRTVYAIKCDIRKFFDSVDHEILRTLLARRIGNRNVLTLLDCIIQSFSVVEEKGIPLGNLTSQLFANIYLHELDHFIKHILGIRLYIRYCDDFVIVHHSRQFLLKLLPIINRFLYDHLQLAMHPEKIYLRSWKQGIDFLGYVLLPYCTVLRTVTKHRILRRVQIANTHSYLGLCAHATSFDFQKIITTKVGFQLH